MAEAAPLTQANRRIKITTVLDKSKRPDEDDPLLPAIMQCSEAISTPYYIDLLMYAKRGDEINPKQIINTAATVSVRIEDFVRERPAGEPMKYRYQLRKGVFLNFQRQDRFHRRLGRDLNVYTARLVPAFMIMDQEVRYRIFEKDEMDFKDVLTACMTSFKGLKLDNYVDMQVLDALRESKDLNKMEHCVQYGESTFNFLSRLMARFSIWYYFDHDAPGLHERMVLGYGPTPGSQPGFKQCTVYDNYPDPRDPEKRALLKSWQFVTGLAKLYTPAPRLTRTSDFNTMQPTNPMQSNDETAQTHVDNKFDIISAADGSDKNGSQCLPNGLPETTFINEQFPDSTIDNDDDATKDAATTMQVDEGQVFTDTASTKNASFCAAKRFRYLPGDDNTKATEFLITRMSLSAYERYWLQFIHHDTSFWAFIDDIIVAPPANLFNQLGSTSGADLTNAMSNAGLQEYSQNWIEQPPGQKPKVPPFDMYFEAGVIGYLTSFLPNTTTVLQDLLGMFSAFVRLVVDVVFGVVQVVANIVEVLADIVLAIPNFVLNLFGVKGLNQKVHQAMNQVHQWLTQAEADVKKMIENLLVRDDDGCTVSFVAEPLDNGKIGPPLPTARNAQVFGPHLATVIGPKGVDAKDGEIWADALGRVRVRFPWDRTPWERTNTIPVGSSTAKLQYTVGMNTAWVRVSEAWAGQKFGTQFLPRIGQEVVVSFVDSDPDRAIITGRVYNADNGTSNLPFSSDLTKTLNEAADLQATATYYQLPVSPFSGIKTRSTLKPDGGDERYHLLRFDDTYNCEQLLLRSQGRLDVTAYASSFETTYGNKNVKVVPGKDADGNIVGGNMYTTVGGEYDLHVGKNRYEQVDGNYELTVKGDTRADLEGNLTAVVKGNGSFAFNSLVIEATEKITLKVGASFIVLDPCAVYINGPSMIYENSGGSPDSAAAVTMQNIADATAAEPGDPQSNNWDKRLTECHAAGGGGGQRGTHTATPTPGPPCDSVVNGVSCGFVSGGGSQVGGTSGGGGAGDGGSSDAPID